ncbi:MAG: hypothetical protein JKP95_00745 [Oceanicaulis sp.]|nr:hypothetical protein [Oceanicaulis sp.]
MGRKSYLCAYPDFIVQDDDPSRGFDRLKAGYRPVSLSQADGFSGGYAGLFAYDLGQAFEDLPVCPRRRADVPSWPWAGMRRCWSLITGRERPGVRGAECGGPAD